VNTPILWQHQNHAKWNPLACFFWILICCIQIKEFKADQHIMLKSWELIRSGFEQITAEGAFSVHNAPHLDMALVAPGVEHRRAYVHLGAVNEGCQRINMCLLCMCSRRVKRGSAPSLWIKRASLSLWITMVEKMKIRQAGGSRTLRCRNELGYSPLCGRIRSQK
jgi:hypothetical protein